MTGDSNIDPAKLFLLTIHHSSHTDKLESFEYDMKIRPPFEECCKPRSPHCWMHEEKQISRHKNSLYPRNIV